MKNENLYLIEFYINRLGLFVRGWDINFAWVKAKNSEIARMILAKKQGNRFDCVIQITEQSEIVNLGSTMILNKNLFIY